MTAFDADRYFAQRAQEMAGTEDKLLSVQLASEEKPGDLLIKSAEKAAALRQINRNSWVNQLGLNPDSFEGTVVNGTASLVSGTGRLLGQLSSLLPNAVAYGDAALINEAERQAYNRFTTGNDTPEDRALLQRKKALVSPNDHPDTIARAQALADANPDAPTVLELINRAQLGRDIGRGTVEATDWSSIVHQDNREALNQDLKRNFVSNWDQVKQGWESLKTGDDLQGWQALAAGMGRLIYHAGESAAKNPTASAEYVLENLPQLAVGLVGKSGGALLSASNVGYGADLYRQGIDNYQKTNGGQLPPEDLRQQMALNAAGAVIAEQLGDKVGLGLMKPFEREGKEALRTGLKAALANTAKAGSEGLLSETATEGVQTHLEGEATLKPASAEDIYIGATIGGIAGAGLTGGGRGIAELAQATPEHAAERQAKVDDARYHLEAIKTGNISEYADPQSERYAPVKALEVLFGHNQQADATPERRADSITQAQAIVSRLEDAREGAKLATKEAVEANRTQLAALQARLVETTPEQVPQIKDQIEAYREALRGSENLSEKDYKANAKALARIDEQLAQARQVQAMLVQQHAPSKQETHTWVREANQPIDTTVEAPAQRSAIDRVLTLSMAAPESVSGKAALRLAENSANALSEDERAYLRWFSEARALENRMKNADRVNREILNGTDPAAQGNRNLGIVQHRARLTEALVAGNQTKADAALGLFNKFVTDQQTKFAAVSAAFDAVRKNGGQFQLVRTKDGQWVKPARWLSKEELDQNNGLTIHQNSGKLIEAMRFGLSAVETAHSEFQAAYNLKFKAAATTSATQTVPGSAPAAQLQSTPVSTVNSVDSQVPSGDSVNSVNQYNEQANVDSQEQSTQGTEVPLSTEVAPVAEAPAVEREVKERKPSDPRKRTDLVGAIMRVTALAGIAPEVAEDALGDRVDQAGKAKSAFRKGGWQDFDKLAELLNVQEGYAFKDGEALKDALRAQVTDRQYNPEQLIERQAKAEHREYVASANQRAAEHGVKGLRGSRTLAHIEADIAKLAAERATFEAEEEALAVAIESLASELQAKDPNLTDTAAWNQAMQAVQALNNEETHGTDRLSTNAQDRGTPQETQAQPAEDRVRQRVEDGATESRTASDPDGKTQADRETGSATDGQLSVFAQAQDWAGKKLADVYQSLNLVAAFLAQKAQKDTDKTARPLVAIKDFLAQWQAGKVSLEPLAGLETFTSAQDKALADLKARLTAWLPSIQQNLIKGYWNAKEAKLKQNPKFEFTDPIQFLVQAGQRGFETDENLQTAIGLAAYTWIVENAGQPLFADEAAVKAMFGVSDYEEIGPDLVTAVRGLGTYEKVLVNALGEKAIQALGFTAKTQSQRDLLPRLASSLGAHALKLLIDKEIVVRQTVPGQLVQENLPQRLARNTNPNATFAFVRLARTKARELETVAREIAAANKGTQSILTKVFGVESELKEPSWAPITTLQKAIRNTNQEIPALLKKYLKYENSVANYVRQDMVGLMREMGQEAWLAMAGFTELDPDRLHVRHRESLEAKNEGLLREYERARDYFEFLEQTSPLALEQPLYFEHQAWKQQRVGIATNVLNPQSSKQQRALLYRKEWETSVSSQDAAMLESFRLRVAEGLGVKTDKQDNAASLNEFSRIFEQPTQDPKYQALRAAVKALQVTVIEGQPMTQEAQAAIVAGVRQGGENLHSLDALIAMAQYESAKAAADGKAFTFTTWLMGEVDGVTNGPMLSHLLLGAANSAQALLVRLNQGGFFRAEDGAKNYNVWRSQPGHQDLYESTIGKVLAHVRALEEDDPAIAKLLPSLWFITGALEKDGKVLKPGRNIIKTPLTAMIFGSAPQGAVDSMFEGFVDSIYDHFEALLELPAEQQESARVALLEQLNTLLQFGGHPGLNDLSIEELLNHDFAYAPEQKAALKAAFQATLGNAVMDTMQTEFADFMATRQVLNQTAQATFALYDAAYQGIRQQFIEELMDRGEMAYTTRKGERVPLHDLSIEQEAKLQARVKAIDPVLHTLMSKESNDLSAGLHISKASRKLSQDPAYHSQVRFPTPIAQDQYSLGTNAYEQAMVAPGVAMLPMSTHSLDSAISHQAAYGTEVLNVHDAHGSGLAHFTRTAQRLNQATWDSTLAYSPAREMRDSWVRTLEGLQTLLERSGRPETMVAGIQQALDALARKYSTKEDKIPASKILARITDRMFETAYLADRTKLEAMSQMVAVDQYALEGGQYDVTEANRQAAIQQLAGLTQIAPDNVMALIQTINRTLAAPVKAETVPSQPVETETVKVATKPVTPSAPPTAVFARIQAEGQLSVKDVIGLLRTQLKAESGALRNFQLTLLDRLEQVVRDDLRIVWTGRTRDNRGQKSIAWYDVGGSIHVSAAVTPGLQAETLLHELTHAATADAIQTPSPAHQALIDELTALKAAAIEYAKSAGLTQWAERLAREDGLHELVAYGMTSREFQEQVLSRLKFASKTRQQAAVTGMKAFIGTLVRFLFKNVEARRQEIAENGLTVLIQNVAGLLASPAAAQTTGLTLSMAAPFQDYTTQQVYDALAQAQPVSPTFDAQLRTLLSGIVDKLHGPFGSLAARLQQQVQSPIGVWNDAKAQGAAKFATEALVAGFRLTEQEAFVAEQVYATVQAALAGPTSQTTAAYRELNKLYQEAKAALTIGSFPGVYAQQLHDFLFKTETGVNNTSDYLARFAALGLAHQDVHQLLAQHATKVNRQAPGNTLIEKLQHWFEYVLEGFYGRLTHTFGGQQMDAKLNALVEQLVTIEAKRRDRLGQSLNTLGVLEQKLDGLSASLRQKLEAFGQSQFLFGPQRNVFLRAAGNVISTAAGGRLEYVLDAITKIRKESSVKRHDLIAGLFDEFKGVTEHNKQAFLLTLAATRQEGKRKALIQHVGEVALEAFANQGKDLTREDKAAITQVFLRTGLFSLLDRYGIRGIYRFLNTPTAVEAEIRRLEAQLTGPNKWFWINQAQDFGYQKATGWAKNPQLLLNAHTIARAFGTRHRVSEVEAVAAEPIIDRLMSLRALQYTDNAAKVQARTLLNQEMRRGQENGIEFVLRLAEHLSQEAKERLFRGSEALMMKGYVPEIYNPHTDVLVAPTSKSAELLAQGYVRDSLVKADPNDPDQTPRAIFVMKDAGLLRYTSGALSMTGRRHKGSRAATQEVTTFDDWKADRDDQRAMERKKYRDIEALFNPRPAGYHPKQKEGNFAVPVVTPTGGVHEYRYLMLEETKDRLLERDSSFDRLLGSLAGNIYDKETSLEQNTKVIQALKDQFDAEYASNSRLYVGIGPKVTNAEHREIYQMLPEETKREIERIWGEGQMMMVRADLVDKMFGYRQPSLSTLFRADPQALNLAEKFFVDLFRGIYGEKAAHKVRVYEDIWREIAKAAKNNIVIKTWTVLRNNILSNFSALYLKGVPLKDIVYHHRIALQGVLAYRKANERLLKLTAKLNTGFVTNRSEVEAEIVRLKDAIARNPVNELIEDGLLPSIVEDVVAEDDPYSYTTRFEQKVAQTVDWLNPVVKEIGSQLYMHKTGLYKVLALATQYSDFLARYTLYQYRKAEGTLSHEERVIEASTVFVNYDFVQHRKLQYLSDMGLVPFTKYYLRIQKVIGSIMRDKPGRALALMVADKYLMHVPNLLDSSLVTHPRLPLPLLFPQTLDELVTVKAGKAVFQ